MAVGRICTRDVDTAGASESVAEVARRLRERGVGSLIVVDREARPMGIVTDRDLVTRVLAVGRDPNATTAADVMTAAPAMVLEGTTIEDALARMRVGRLRRLPVVDGRGRLVGLVTLDDILELLAEEFSSIGTLLDREAPHQPSA